MEFKVSLYRDFHFLYVYVAARELLTKLYQVCIVLYKLVCVISGVIMLLWLYVFLLVLLCRPLIEYSAQITTYIQVYKLNNSLCNCWYLQVHKKKLEFSTRVGTIAHQ